MNSSRSCDLDKALDLPIVDENGDAESIKNILWQQAKPLRRTLIVFIRHMFCGNCQEYVRRLSTQLSPSSLPEDLSILIIGCGVPSLIPSYIETTKCPFPMYTDPSTRIYQALGMQRSISLGPKDPAYIRHSLASGMLKSMIQGIKRIPSGDVSKGGDLRVNGGEFLFTRDAEISDWRISWSHCMMNTRDHTEIDVLETKLRLPNQAIEVETSNSGVRQQSQKDVDAASCSDMSEDDPCNKPVPPVRRSFTMKRHSWMVKATQLTRSSSLRRTMIHAS